VKNWFQAFAFECNLYRYSVARARAEDRAENARKRAQNETADAKLHVTEFLASYRNGAGGAPADDDPTAATAAAAAATAAAAAAAPTASSYMSPRVPPAHPNGVSAAVVAAATVSPAPHLLNHTRGSRSNGGLRASRSILTASMQSLSTVGLYNLNPADP
jgi:hypothetical protein